MLNLAGFLLTKTEGLLLPEGGQHPDAALQPWRVGGVAARSSGRALETSWPHILYGFRVHPGDQWLPDRRTDRETDR